MNKPIINPVDNTKTLKERTAEHMARAREYVAKNPLPPEEYIEPTEYDEVSKPQHYMLMPGVEVLDVIEAALLENGIPTSVASHYGNVLKYMLRCGRKGKLLQDLKKARFYLDRMISVQEGVKDA